MPKALKKSRTVLDISGLQTFQKYIGDQIGTFCLNNRCFLKDNNNKKSLRVIARKHV